MSNDDKRNSNTSSDISLSPINDFVDLADRTIDNTFKKVSKIVHDYGGDWEDTISSGLPSIFWGGRDQLARKYDEWLRDDDGTMTNRENVLPLDETKPSHLWAYPVPSTKQYSQCQDLGGNSVWTREGVWRCLFPASQADLDAELRKPKDERRLYGDYTGFLDWKAGMRRAMLAARAKERAEQEKNQPQRQMSSLWSGKPKYISESEATAAGKRIVSSSISSETITKDDGSLETKKVVQKWYDDGTTSKTEEVSNSVDKTSGWFWKK